MKKITTIKSLPLLAALAGSIGFVLKLLVDRFAVDHRQLLITEHPAVVALYLCTAAVLGLTFLLSRQVGDSQGSFPVNAGTALSTFILAPCVLFLGVRAALSSTDRLIFIVAASALIAIVCFIIDGVRWGKDKLFGGYSYGAAALFLLFYTISRQQAWSLDAQPARLFFPFMTVIFLAMAMFYRAYLTVGGKCLRNYLFFQYGAAFFTLANLREDPLLWGVFALSLLLAPLPEEKPQMELPEDVLLCLKKLKKAGFEAYVVGGCVRDSLLGITPNDYDICTNAKPDKIADVFSDYELVRSGEKHGTIGVVINGKLYEITTFRTEGDYTDSRHPDWVNFVEYLQEDLERRDFTINAIAFSPATGYIDPFGGEQDLKNGLLRTVGNPMDRFTEDALRILRGVRFAVRFRLRTELATYAAMLALTEKMDDLARERVFAELKGLLPFMTAEELIHFSPVITQVIPELGEAVDFQQHSPHHAYDVYTHTAHVVEALPMDTTLRLAALLHDVGKPRTFFQDENGRGHFHGHAAVGANMADEILLRLKAPTAMRQQVVTLIENHMIDLLPDKKFLRKKLAKFGKEMLENIITLQQADFCSKGVEEQTEHFTQLWAVLREVQAEASCLCVKDLAIDGNDLQAAGIQPGPQMGEILNKLLEMVLEETLENEKTALLQAAKDLGGTA